MQPPPRETWTFTDWLAAGGWGMYAIEASAAIALPLNVLHAFRPGPKIRRAAFVATAMVVVVGGSFWWWSLHGLEKAIQSLPEDQQQEIRTQGHVEIHGVLEALAAIVALAFLAGIVSVIAQRALKRDERQFQPRGLPWHPLGFVLYALAGIFLLPQGAFQCAYAWGFSWPRVSAPLLGGLLALVLGTGLVICGSLLRGVRRPTNSTG